MNVTLRYLGPWDSSTLGLWDLFTPSPLSPTSSYLILHTSTFFKVKLIFECDFEISWTLGHSDLGTLGPWKSWTLGLWDLFPPPPLPYTSSKVLPPCPTSYFLPPPKISYLLLTPPTFSYLILLSLTLLYLLLHTPNITSGSMSCLLNFILMLKSC